MTDCDAARYHRISDPQLAWGRAVAARLEPADGERVLDIGCGTGRLMGEIARRPEIGVVGLDHSAAMLQEAARHAATLKERPLYVRGDGAALPFVDAFDAVFSAATFHWIPDHDRLFASVFTALRSGGRFVAQADAFMDQLTDQAPDDDPPLTLDYRRLNIAARKARR